MKRKGVLAVISGFSGAGKGTVTRGMLEKYDCYALSVSATSRSPRPGEEEGVHYFFKTRAEFERMIAEDAFLEHAVFVGNHYGTPKDYVFKKLSEGKDVILEIEVLGALQVKEKFPDAITIFLTAPDAESLKNRLVGRNTESIEKIRERLNRAKEEATLMDKYDYLVVNDDVDSCIERIHQLISSQHMRTELNKEFIADMTCQLNDI